MKKKDIKKNERYQLVSGLGVTDNKADIGVEVIDSNFRHKYEVTSFGRNRTESKPGILVRVIYAEPDAFARGNRASLPASQLLDMRYSRYGIKDSSAVKVGDELAVPSRLIVAKWEDRLIEIEAEKQMVIDDDRMRKETTAAAYALQARAEKVGLKLKITEAEIAFQYSTWRDQSYPAKVDFDMTPEQVVELLETGKVKSNLTTFKAFGQMGDAFNPGESIAVERTVEAIDLDAARSMVDEQGIDIDRIEEVK